MTKKLVEIEWVDSMGCGKWHSISVAEKHEPSRCRSAGYLIHDGKTCLTLALSLWPDGDDCDSTITIPRAAVVKRRTLK